MKAVRVSHFGAPSVMKLEDASDPQPGADEVVVRVNAIGVNPVDAYIRSGTYGERPLPYTPGSDAAGTVEALGADVRGFALGDRVYVAGTISGAYAEKALCKAFQVHPLPDAISFAQGAAMGVPYGTAYRALFGRGNARKGEILLVHGASGGVGVAATQLAVAAGLTVIGTAGSDRGCRLVAEQGAQHVVDHHAPDFAAQIQAITNGEGINLILEMLANENLGMDLELLAQYGRVVIVGNRGKVEIDPRQTMSRDSSILGMSLMNATEAELASIHTALIAGLERGVLRPIIGQQIPLAEAPRAHEAVMRPGAYGKIVLIP